MYPDLYNVTSIDELLSPYGSFVLLYVTAKVGNDPIGHWTTVIRHPWGIEFFDPYGFRADEEFEGADLDQSRRAALGEPTNRLDQLLRQAHSHGERVFYNEDRLQRMSRSVGTCGRWVVLRLLLNHLNEHQFQSLGLTDERVYDITERMLHART